jgi:hypothetical protein
MTKLFSAFVIIVAAALMLGFAYAVAYATAMQNLRQFFVIFGKMYESSYQEPIPLPRSRSEDAPRLGETKDETTRRNIDRFIQRLRQQEAESRSLGKADQ